MSRLLHLSIWFVTSAYCCEYFIHTHDFFSPSLGQVLQTGARLVWDIDFGKILSLVSEVPSEVRLEYQGCKWSIKTSQVDAVAKSFNDRVHSCGSSSYNAVQPLPGLDVRQSLGKFPLIDTHGDSNAVLKYMSLMRPSGFYELIEHFAAFGPRFQWLKELRGTAHEGMAVISVRIRE